MEQPLQEKLEGSPHGLPKIHNPKNQAVVPEYKRRNFDLSRQFQPHPLSLGPHNKHYNGASTIPTTLLKKKKKMRKEKQALTASKVTLPQYIMP